MAEVAKLTAKLDADTRKFNSDMKKAKKSLGGLEQSTGKATKSLGGMKTAATAMGGVLLVGAFAKGVTSAINRAEEMSSQYAITAQIIEQTGDAANVTGIHVKEMAKEMAFTTGLDKAVLNNAANVLLTFKEIQNVAGENNAIFDRALTVTTDMATVFGGSAVDAAKQLGKALNDPVLGVTALSRVGVQFTEDQKAQIKAMVEANDVLGAQQIILQEIEGQVGGTAAASADASDKIKVAWQEVLEVMGEELLPVLEEVAGAAIFAAKSSDNFGTGAQGLNKLVSRAADLINLGFTDFWDDADEALFQFSKTQDHASQRMKDGAKAGDVMVDWLVNMEKHVGIGDVTWQRMIDTLQIGDQELRTVIQTLGRNAEALGISAEATAFMKEIYDGLPTPIHETESALYGYELAAAAAGDETVDLASDLDKVTAATDRMRSAFSGNLFGDAFSKREFEQGLLLAGGVGSGQVDDFASGGVVSGPLGKPRMAVVHGGEEIVTSADRNVTVNMNGNLTTQGMLQEELSLGLLMAGVNSQAEFSGLADIRG